MSLDYWMDLYKLPVAGMIMMHDGHFIHLPNALPDDTRDTKSFYASSSWDLPTAVVFIFDVESDGLLLQAVDKAAQPPPDGKGMCASTLSAHVSRIRCNVCNMLSPAAFATCTGFLAPRPHVNMDAMYDFLSCGVGSRTVLCFPRCSMLQSKPHYKFSVIMVMHSIHVHSVCCLASVEDRSWDGVPHRNGARSD